ARHSANPERRHGDRTMTMTIRMTRLTRPLAGMALLLASSAALAETKIGADLGVNAGYATNAYGATGGDTGSATLSGSFAPSIVRTSPTGTTTLNGQVSHTEYSRHYSGTTNYNVA